MEPSDVLRDLREEHEALDGVVADLPAQRWTSPTPSAGWTVAHQIAHLTYFDRAAAQAIAEPEAFAEARDELVRAVLEDGTDPDEHTLGGLLGLEPAALLTAWREGRASLLEAGAGLSAVDRVEWYGPSMGAASFLTARLMETWAHGQDIVDALEAHREPTDRLAHVARLGFITRGWSYANRGRTAPEAPVRVELTLPGGTTIDHGPADAGDRIVGAAEDFCLVVTQRRHVEDTGLAVEGDAAREWMELAQAFAGGATDGPPAQRAGG
jgi:uncharacterized protein (TIGR03084 family)